MRGSVLAVGTVGALLSFSWVAVCKRVDTREHGRGWRSLVRSSTGRGEAEEWELACSQSRVVDASAAVGEGRRGKAGDAGAAAAATSKWRVWCVRQVIPDFMNGRLGASACSCSSITIRAS